MEQSANTYMPPYESTDMPEEILNYLNGEELLSKNQALRISTVNANGAPHAALLSAGDAIALPDGRLRFVMFSQSTTTTNIIRDGHFTFTMVFNNGLYELRFRAKKLKDELLELPLTFFEGNIILVRRHKVPYASVITGITFLLNDPETILDRWQRQIKALREF
jgi:hypothetical protein